MGNSYVAGTGNPALLPGGNPSTGFEAYNNSFSGEPAADSAGASTTYNNATAAGYQWDPVQAKFVMSPAQTGTNINTLDATALGETPGTNPILAGLQAAAGGLPGLSGSGSTGATGVSTSGGTNTPTGVPAGGGSATDIAPIDQTAANAATFGAAKDQAGQTGLASLQSLRGLLGESGGAGSGAEVQGTQNIVENAAGQVGAVTRANATNTAAQNLSVAQSNQATQLASRGQDIQAQEAASTLAAQQAQAQATNSLAMLKMALGLASPSSAGTATSGLYEMAAKVTTPAPTVPLPQTAWESPTRVALPTTSPADWVDPELNAFNAQKGLALASVMGAPVPSLSFGTGTGTAPSLKGLKAAVAPTEAADGSNYDLQGNYVGAGAYDPAGNWTDPYGTGWQGPTPVGQPQWSQASGGME